MLVAPISWCGTVARVVDEDLCLARVRGVRKHVGDIEVERLRFAEASAVQQQCDEHAAIVVAPGRTESLDQQFFETLFRESRRLARFYPRQASTSYTVPDLGGGYVCRPGVSKECLAASVLVGRLVGLSVERSPRIAWVHL
ncbi:hypothetical protein D3C76_1313500 [compost metagenome]